MQREKQNLPKKGNSINKGVEKEIMISCVLLWQCYPQGVRRGNMILETEKPERLLNMTNRVVVGMKGKQRRQKDAKDAKDNEARAWALLSSDLEPEEGEQSNMIPGFIY